MWGGMSVWVGYEWIMGGVGVVPSRRDDRLFISHPGEGEVSVL